MGNPPPPHSTITELNTGTKPPYIDPCIPGEVCIRVAHHLLTLLLCYAGTAAVTRACVQVPRCAQCHHGGGRHARAYHARAFVDVACRYEGPGTRTPVPVRGYLLHPARFSPNMVKHGQSSGAPPADSDRGWTGPPVREHGLD